LDLKDLNPTGTAHQLNMNYNKFGYVFKYITSQYFEMVINIDDGWYNYIYSREFNNDHTSCLPFIK